MATTGTTAFTLEAHEIIEDAFARLGVAVMTGDDARRARRALGLMMIDWQNRGLNLWAVDDATVTLVADTAAYALPATVNQVYRVSYRETATTTDRFLDPMDFDAYADISDKGTSGTPTRWWMDRQRATPRLVLWQAPDTAAAADGTLVYWHARKLEDVALANELDIPYRFLPAAVSGLAAKLAEMKSETPPELRMMLAARAESEWRMAYDADGTLTTFSVRPDLRGYWG